MKGKNMKAKYTGCTDAQAKWGKSRDPRSRLVEGKEYEISEVEKHTWHTVYYIKDCVHGPFNSVCFEVTEE
jgi:hypothetical protein